jgi:predicted site-specific integrase-resolvase
MGYLPPVRNDQYIQYANRSISQKSNYAYIQKTANIPSERAYREVEKREENQTAAFRRVEEKKRKKALNRRVAKKAESGRFVNDSV